MNDENGSTQPNYKTIIHDCDPHLEGQIKLFKDFLLKYVIRVHTHY